MYLETFYQTIEKHRYNKPGIDYYLILPNNFRNITKMAFFPFRTTVHIDNINFIIEIEMDSKLDYSYLSPMKITLRSLDIHK